VYAAAVTHALSTAGEIIIASKRIRLSWFNTGWMLVALLFTTEVRRDWTCGTALPASVRLPRDYFTRRILPFFLFTLQQQDDINGKVKRATTLAIGTVPVVALAATVISSSVRLPHAQVNRLFLKTMTWAKSIFLPPLWVTFIRKFNTAL